MDASGQQTVQMKRRKNATLPVAKLPMEILAQIFLLLARTQGTQLFVARSDRWDWLEVSRVCKTWRDLALGYTSLWSEINTSFSKDRVKVFLERSKGADLIVELGGFSDYECIKPGILELVRDHMNRVQYFKIIEREDTGDWDEILGLFDSPVPRLKALHLISHTDNMGVEHGPSVDFEDLVLLASVGHLEELSLRAVLLPWNSPVFMGLSSLSLEDIDYGHEATIDELLVILAASPNLRDLTLTDAVKFCPLRTNRDKIHLLQLKKLYIAGIDYGVLFALFDSLVITEDLRWMIEAVHNPFVGTDRFPSALLDRKAICRDLSIKLANTAISIEPSFDSRKRQWGDECDMLLQINHEHAPTLPLGYVSFFQSLGTFFEHPFFDSVICLTISMGLLEEFEVMDSMTTAAWTHLFAAFPKLDGLEVYFAGKLYSGAESHLIPALAWSIDSRKEVLPELKSIDFVCGEFSTRKGRDAYEKLLSDLVSRGQSGKYLKKLTFRMCDGIGQKELQQMKELNIAKEITCKTQDW